ncbi:MAG: hypothetical protein ACI9W1_002997, partial [Candidatus Azotimanducaceae bacterium]
VRNQLAIGFELHTVSGEVDGFTFNRNTDHVRVFIAFMDMNEKLDLMGNPGFASLIHIDVI